MDNPFAVAADKIKARAIEIEDADRMALVEAEAKERAKAQSFENAKALFARMEDRIGGYIMLANEALGGGEFEVSAKSEPIRPDFAGSVTVSLLYRGKPQKSFKAVGNASFKAFIHDIENPKFGPFDLNDVDVLPFEEIFNRFLMAAADVLKKD